MMNSFQEDSSNWNLIDYNSIIIEDAVAVAAAAAAAASTDYYWTNNNSTTNQSVCMELDASPLGFVSQEKGCSKKRGRNEACSMAGSKACREKMRRDKMNDRFADLSSILEPGRPAKTDKSAILNDAIRALNQLRAESQDLKEANEKLQEEIKNLKAEKNELREEKLVLKADKEKMEQQVKSMNVLPGGFVSPHPATYPAGVNKMMAYPNYGGFPMWQWIPPTALDTSQDHVLRPPVA